MQNEMQELYSALASKVYDVLNDYAKKHGYTLVLDVAQQQSPVLYATDSTNITKAIIDAYNVKSGVPAPTTPAAGTAPVPSAPKPAAPKAPSPQSGCAAIESCTRNGFDQSHRHEKAPISGPFSSHFDLDSSEFPALLSLCNNIEPTCGKICGYRAPDPQKNGTFSHLPSSYTL